MWYLPRFKYLSDKAKEWASLTFGGTDFFNWARVIHSIAVHADFKPNNPNEMAFWVLNNEKKHLIPDNWLDQWAFNFLWTYTDASITTGEILWKE